MELPQRVDRFVLSSSSDDLSARYVFFGVKDTAGSKGLAYREGAEEGPASLRKASQMYCAFHRTEAGRMKTYLTNSYRPVDAGTFPLTDRGDVEKSAVASIVTALLRNDQVPVMVGGDHSITYEALKGINEVGREFAVVYFDAHPDLRSSDAPNYASGMWHAQRLSNMVTGHSVQVGLSDIEPEEFRNHEQSEIHWITALDIQQDGVAKTLKRIRRIARGMPVYLSIDLDVLDHVFVPGVSTPSPCGLTSRELLFLLTELAAERVIGLDVMEHTPASDKDAVTAIVGARLLIEFLVRHSVQSRVA